MSSDRTKQICLWMNIYLGNFYLNQLQTDKIWNEHKKKTLSISLFLKFLFASASDWQNMKWAQKTLSPPLSVYLSISLSPSISLSLKFLFASASDRQNMKWAQNSLSLSLSFAITNSPVVKNVFYSKRFVFAGPNHNLDWSYLKMIW